MRILLLSQYFYPEVGATQTRMYEFARHLAASGHDVTVISEFPNHPHGRIPDGYGGKLFENEARDGFTIWRVWVWASPIKNFRTRMLFYNSFMTMAILRALSLNRPDVVMATSPPLFVGVAGYVISRLRGSHFVLDVRDLWPAAAVALGELRNPRFIGWAKRAELFLYQNAKQITAVTQGFCRYIASLGISRDKITWLPNGTVVSLFKPGNGDSLLRKESGMEGRFLVTFAGTQGIAQGLDTALKAAELSRNDPTVGFVLIGDGPIHQQLVDRKNKLQLANVYFKKQVPLTEIVPFLNASDALLVTLKRDPVFETFIPSKMFDFMACAKPILLGVNGEAQEILNQAQAGLHFMPEDPNALLRAIHHLRDNPALCAEMGSRGRRFVEKYFDRSNQARQLENVILTLGRRTGAPVRKN